jgi:hypothetical protein
MDYDGFRYKLTWKVETKEKTKHKKPQKIYDECTAWFPHEETREKHITRLKREGAKFIKKSNQRDSKKTVH